MTNTIQRKRTKRYAATEQKILASLNAIFNEGGGAARVTVGQLCRKAGIRYSTLYLHYRGINRLVEANTRAAAELVAEIAKKYEGRRFEDLRPFFRELLLCVHKNYFRFGIECGRESVRLWRLVMAEIRPVVTQGWPSYGGKNDDMLYRQYSAEFIGIVYDWGGQGFRKDGIDRCLTRIMLLTDAGVRRQREIAVMRS